MLVGRVVVIPSVAGWHLNFVLQLDCLNKMSKQLESERNSEQQAKFTLQTEVDRLQHELQYAQSIGKDTQRTLEENSTSVQRKLEASEQKSESVRQQNLEYREKNAALQAKLDSAAAQLADERQAAAIKQQHTAEQVRQVEASNEKEMSARVAAEQWSELHKQRATKLDDELNKALAGVESTRDQLATVEIEAQALRSKVEQQEAAVMLARQQQEAAVALARQQQEAAVALNAEAQKNADGLKKDYELLKQQHAEVTLCHELSQSSKMNY